jgi:SAM-dependent methyltransferase
MEWSRMLLDEIALAGQEHLDPAYVAAYDRKTAFDPSDDLVLLRELGLGRQSTLVDLGAGTGTLALAAAAHCGRVVGVDASAEMVAAMSENADRLGVANVECVEAGFLSYEHHGAPADFVYSRNALHHLPDFWKAIALERIALILCPGGVLHLRDLVFSFDPSDAERFVADWLDSGAELPEDGFTRADFEAHLRNEFSTFSWLLEPMLERAGFEITSADYGSRRMHAEYVCLTTAR